jgi:hypothetical protein
MVPLLVITQKKVIMLNKKTEALMKTLTTEKVSVIHAAFGDDPYVVAFVDVEKSWTDTDKLECAFMKTNSINDAWWKNEGVTSMFPNKGCRSTSVGDMVLIGETKYKCSDFGWEKI